MNTEEPSFVCTEGAAPEAQAVCQKGYRMLLNRSLAIFTFCAAIITPLLGLSEERFQGRTVAVLDGDTIDVVTDEREKIRVRLAGIDAPEKSQAYGQRSKQNLAAMVGGKTVEIVDRGNDQYGRTVGSISVDGIDVNAEQVKSGFAWVYSRYNRDNELPSLETQARRDQLGLWRDKNPIAPWLYRRAE